MPAKTITYSDVLAVLECGSCHISFAIPRDMLTAREDDGQSFWCPNGCKIHYRETRNSAAGEAAQARAAAAGER